MEDKKKKAAIVKEGLLGKQGGNVKTRWQDRWVVIYEDKTLTYRKWRSEEELQGTIKNLDQCGAYPTDSKKKEEAEVVFHLDTPAPRTFRFKAEDKSTRDAWVAALVSVGAASGPLAKPAGGEKAHAGEKDNKPKEKEETKPVESTPEEPKKEEEEKKPEEPTPATEEVKE